MSSSHQDTWPPNHTIHRKTRERKKKDDDDDEGKELKVAFSVVVMSQHHKSFILGI